MPKLITTRTRIPDLGKPRIIIIGGGFGAMATIGRNRAVADLPGFKTQGFFAWLIWMFVHLISLIGFKSKFFVLMNWLWSYFSYDKSNRLIIARPKDGIQ